MPPEKWTRNGESEVGIEIRIETEIGAESTSTGATTATTIVPRGPVHARERGFLAAIEITTTTTSADQSVDMHDHHQTTNATTRAKEQREDGSHNAIIQMTTKGTGDPSGPGAQGRDRGLGRGEDIRIRKRS